jgi:hypothetical protein
MTARSPMACLPQGVRMTAPALGGPGLPQAARMTAPCLAGCGCVPLEVPG